LALLLALGLRPEASTTALGQITEPISNHLFIYIIITKNPYQISRYDVFDFQENNLKEMIREKLGNID
jgi:hypothetical protein